MVILIYGEEIWKDVDYPGVKPGLYEVSNYGKIRNKKRNKILKAQRQNGKYVRLILQTGRPEYPEGMFSVHRIVAYAFVKNPDPATKTRVHHKDGDKGNNYCDNLEWVTPEENVREAVKDGLHWQYVGESNPNAIFTNAFVIDIDNLSIAGKDRKYIFDYAREKYPEYSHIPNKRFKNYIGRIIRHERYGKILDNKSSTTIKRNID